MRTRSHPVSPGGLVSLDDVPAPRRRSTRSVSAQPQDAEPGLGAVEAARPKPTPKTRRTRAKSTRGKKSEKSSRRPTKSAEPEQNDAAGISAEEVGQDDIEMVGSPQVAIDDEHVTPLVTVTEDPAAERCLPADPMQDVENVVPTISGTASSAQSPVANIGEPVMEIDHPDGLMQDLHYDALPIGLELLVAYPELSADQFAAEQNHEDREMQDEPTSVIPSIETGEVEHGAGAGAAAQHRNLARRTPRTSPPRRSSTSQRATEGSQVLRPQKATPIRRSYSNISQTRRTEASGRINRTLYRLPDLLTQNDSDGEASAQDRHQVVETQENVSVIANPTTPEAARPSTPMTAPPAAHVGNPLASPNASPSWSRWIFNNVSRRWTNIRERLVPRPTDETPSTAEAVEAAEAVEQYVAPTTSAETSLATATAPEVPPEAVAPLPARNTWRRRSSFRSSFLPHDLPASRPRRPRRISTTDRPVAAPKPRPEPIPASELRYDLFPRPYDPELLKRCYARGTNPHLTQLSETADTTQTINKAAISAPNEAISSPNDATPASTEDQSLKRKREEPEKIPNPKGCSYGMDEEYFDFTDAEWDEEEKRLAALEAKETAQPVSKKQRVDASQPRRRATTRPNTPNAPLSSMSPSRRPGFVPNRRGTYTAPDLSPIDSSGLMSGMESSPVTQPSSDQTAIVQPTPKSTGATQTHQLYTPKTQRDPGSKFKPSGTYQAPSCSSPLAEETPSDELPPVPTTPPRARNTFETPYSPEWPSPGFTPSPPREYWDFWADLDEKQIRERRIHLAIAHYARTNGGGVITNVMMRDHPIFASIDMDCYHRSVNRHGHHYGPTLLEERRRFTARFLQNGRMKLEPLYFTYSDGTFRAYSETEDTPLVRVRGDGNLGTHHAYTREPKDQTYTDDVESQVTASNPDDVPESRENAPTPPQNLEPPAATTQDREAPTTDTDTDADDDDAADGPSPLTRARNKAEQFKPKTPSRLREAHPFASSIASATTASPSFLGVTTGTPSNFGATMNTSSNLGALTSSPAIYSDLMSIDTTLEPATPGDDANWLRQVCPSGDISQLPWPEPVSLVETLGIDPAAADLVNQNVDPKKEAEAAAAWQTMWEEFQRGELVF